MQSTKRPHGGAERPQTAFSTFKRRRVDPNNDDDDKTGLASLLLHQVNCAAKAAGHESHAEAKLYLDPPRLFAGDCKASEMRGRQPVPESLEEYIRANPGVAVAVVRSYDCEQYCESIEDDFVQLPLPGNIANEASVLPYFQQLEGADGRAPRASRETIHMTLALREAMERLDAFEPSMMPGWKSALVSPYLQLYHVRARIRQAAREAFDGDDPRGAHVGLLLDFVEEHEGPGYEEAHSRFEQGVVPWQHFSKLYRPGDVVVTHEDGEPVAFCVSSYPRVDEESGELELKCFNWGFDGHFRRQEKDMTVAWPRAADGSALLLDLAAQPLRFDRTGQMEQHLRSRGEMFWSCRRRRLVTYTASAAPFEIRVSAPRYMIDTIMYHEIHDRSNPADNSSGEPKARVDEEIERQMGSETLPEGPFVYLLPPRILGFTMHDKKWRPLLVKNISPVSWNKRAFSQLVLSPQKKELIEAMVRTHVSSNMSTDVISGKGNGLIVLLHGGPGTGKTLTAESVAELAERPLYRVTCGDIGTDAENVESYLESVLYIGSAWKAVVLLDESDVFLEEREKADLERNALVSVFLRVLEYYEGILILTSNRVGTFDEAFKSRVQLALHYPPLDRKGRAEIWSNFFSTMKREQECRQSDGVAGLNGDKPALLAAGETIDAQELEDKVDSLARKELNGRQIRNAITTARQLARFKNRPLGYAHLEQTISISDEFEDYIERTHGHKNVEYVQNAGTRLE